VAQTEPTELQRLPGGELEVPADYARAGWLVDGAVPGAPGPAVLGGHIDSRSGPAVFYRLGSCARATRSRWRCPTAAPSRSPSTTSCATRRTPSPHAARYRPVPGSPLRLITCGGAFDPAARSYRDDVVVFASAG
jgi:hypothetical protein